MSEEKVEEVWSEIKLLEVEKEKQRDRFERCLENGFSSKDLEKLLGKFEETVTSLNTLKTKEIEHRKTVEILTVEELTKARKENLLPYLLQGDKDTYQAVASIEKHLINERPNEVKQNLHTWHSQPLPSLVSSLETDTRALLSRLKCVNRWVKAKIEHLNSTAIQIIREFPRQNRGGYAELYLPKNKRLDNTTTDVCTDPSNSSSHNNITIDSMTSSSTDSPAAPSGPTKVIDLAVSPVPNPSLTPKTPRRDLKRPIVTNGTPVSKQTHRLMSLPVLNSRQPQQQQTLTYADHAGMLSNLDRAINVQLNRRPVEQGIPLLYPQCENIEGKRVYRETPTSLISKLSDLMIQKPGPMYNDLLEVIVESHIKSHETQTTVSTPRPVTSS
ncbi:unnamed protein product [Lepeophtheirus salmonis]|uniref:(salmon louse) hypothetical protein n=1 Tax=Lepeophtheirus salmonis TaxID=72036 RepID=A0A817FGR5_LEPSM|nr:unnamed protein product [Lepeophtheirus salmonis]